MTVQVDKSHYLFDRYITPKRWASMWHQVSEVMALSPRHVLEIGPGPGIFKSVLKALGVDIKTLDIDKSLDPDFLAPATQIPLEDMGVDVTCAFQVLEHMPFHESMLALKEMCRVTESAIIISLPDARTRWPTIITVPKCGIWRIMLSRPFYVAHPHSFDGQHYWEISKKGYSLNMVMGEMIKFAPEFDIRTFLVHQNPYHRFFVLKRKISSY